MGTRVRSMNRVGIFLSLLAFAPLVGAAEQKEKGAPTPEEAVKQVYASLQAGKVADALPYIAEPERGYWAKYLQAAKAMEDYLSALDDKFGKDPEFRRKFDLVEQVKHRFPIEVRAVKEGGKDKVQLIVWEKRTGPGALERKLDAIRTETGWKLHYRGSPNAAKREERTGPDSKKLVVWVEIESEEGWANEKAEIDFLRVEAAKRAQAVRAGKYKTRQEAFKGILNRIGPHFDYRPRAEAPKKKRMAAAEERHDALKELIAKSRYIIAGELSTAPTVTTREAGAVGYKLELKVVALLKNRPPEEAQAVPVRPRKDEPFVVTFRRVEPSDEDKLPFLKKGAKCIVFLKYKQTGQKGFYAPEGLADVWLGIQPYSPSLAKTISDLGKEEKDKRGRESN